MNFISNVLDVIPVVGHVKGIVHYVQGDTDAMSRALYQSSRTTAVLGMGVLCAPAGLLVSAVGAVGGAGLTDSVTSLATGKAEGILQDCEKVVDDIQRGEDPTKSLLSTAGNICIDAAGGLGMGGLSSVTKEGAKIATKTFGKKLAQKVVQTTGRALVATHMASRSIQKPEEGNTGQGSNGNRGQESRGNTGQESRGNTGQETRGNTGQESSGDTGQRSSGNTNQEARGNTRQESSGDIGQGSNGNSGQGSNGNSGQGSQQENNSNSIYSRFLKLLEKCLNTYWNNRKPSKEEIYAMFERQLQPNQKKYLRKVIKNFGSLEAVLKLVIQMFDKHFPRDFTFLNFLSLMEFVDNYINREVAYRNIETNHGQSEISRDELLSQISRMLNDIISQPDIIQKMFDDFQSVRSEIESANTSANEISPNFRDTFSAVYHYFKHKCVPGDGVLSATEYYDLIRDLLKKVKHFEQYSDLENPQNRRTCMRFEQYVVQYRGGSFHMRIRIIIGIPVNEIDIVLSSCYILSEISEILRDSDEDGDIFIDGERQRRADPDGFDYNAPPP